MSEQSDETEFHLYSPHLSSTKVRALVETLEGAEDAKRRELMTRLAWRPAWAIRSRRNSLKPFLSLFRKTHGKKSAKNEDAQNG